MQNRITRSTKRACTGSDRRARPLGRRADEKYSAVDVHLRLFPLGQGGQGVRSEDPWANALGDTFDHATVSRRIAPFENDDDFEALVLYPFLELNQLDVKLVVFLFEFFPL